MLVALAVAGAFWYRKEPPPPIVSDDGAATLHVPPGALPKGTRVADLTIRAAPVPGGALAAYALAPSGLTFSAPVTLTARFPPERAPAAAPVVRVFDDAGQTVEPIAATTTRDADGAVTVSVPLSHFSTVLFNVGLIAVEAPNDLGTHAVGESFSFPVTVARLAEGRLREDASFKEIMVGRPTFITPGRFSSETPAVVSVDDTASTPAEGTKLDDVTMTVTGRFRCVAAGRGRVQYDAHVHYQHRFEPPTSLPPWVKPLGERVGVIPGAVVQCVGPSTSPAASPASPAPSPPAEETSGDPGPSPRTPPPDETTSSPVPAVSPPAAVSRSTNRPPTASPIRASLNPPTTTYTVQASDPDGDTLTYRWSTTGTCGSFAGGGGASTTWSHPSGEPPGGCPHEEGTSHPGTITVRVSDGRATVTCSYQGSESGTGSACASAP